MTPDAIFADPRLAVLYDGFDSPRPDLEPYLEHAAALGARAVLDVGCGTGTFACLLAAGGVDVVGVDPAAASLDVARAKPHADRVRWLHGDATALPPLAVDLATMTGNVAQVFVEDDAWAATLAGIAAALRPGGHLRFETRDPAAEAWRSWTPDATRRRVGDVEQTTEVRAVDGPLVSFRHTYRFDDGTELTSDSTLRFRTRAEVETSLAAALDLLDVTGAPDRPGLELVFLAQRSP